MRILLLISLFLSSLSIFSQSRGISNTPSNDKDNSMTAEEVEMIVPVISQFSPKTQFAMALIKEGEVRYFGLTLHNGKVVPIDNRDSVFEIGSLTKVFTTHLLANLVRNNKVSLDQAIAPHLDFSINGNPNITFGQLATHQSGLPYFPSNVGGLFNQKNPFKDYSQEKFEQFLSSKLKMKEKPGEQYLYSNVGMGLLGYLMASLNGQSYEKCLQEQIFTPLDMRMSTTERARIQGRLVIGRNHKGTPTLNWDLGALVGAGGALSSVRDLVKYAQYSFDALPEALGKNTLLVDKRIDMALGWHIMNDQRVEPFLWHNGGTGGYKASMAIAPSQQDAVIILSNVGTDTPGKRAIDELCFKLMVSLEGTFQRVK